MTVSIRRFRTGDGEGSYETFVRAVRELGSTEYSEPQIVAWLSGMNAEILEARLRSMISFVAEQDGRVVGFASLDARYAELDFLYVDPALARQGIGRRLAAHVESAAREAQIEFLHIVASLNAIAVYERLGYAREFDLVKTIDGVKVPCVRMVKELFRREA